MNDDSDSTLTQMIEGPVPTAERMYAFDRMRDLCRTAPRAIRRARISLSDQPDSTGGCPASADGTLMLYGGLILSAGVVAATMHEAVDLLMARFRHRLHRLEETGRGQPIGSFPANAT
jgi:ribosome-associated translation inhibitor RaiA